MFMMLEYAVTLLCSCSFDLKIYLRCLLYGGHYFVNFLGLVHGFLMETKGSQNTKKEVTKFIVII